MQKEKEQYNGKIIKHKTENILLCIFKAKTKTMQLCVFIKRHIALTIHYKNNVAVSPKTKPCFPFSLLSPNILASIQLFSFWSCQWNPFSPFDKNVNKALLPLWPNVHESLWNNRVCLMMYIKGQKLKWTMLSHTPVEMYVLSLGYYHTCFP